MEPEKTLFITEIYKSVQGESSYAGLPCTFIRLSGCPLRCKWCDTVYSFKKGVEKSLSIILDEVKKKNCNLVELTGGEPLAQKQSLDLMDQLIKNNYKVLLETSGSISLKEVPEKVHIIMDLKCPDSRMDQHNNWNNLKFLKPSDEIKFVIASRSDFEWALTKIKEFQLTRNFQILFSPAWGLLKPDLLVEWILDCEVQARLNLQQHKYIWNPRKKGV